MEEERVVPDVIDKASSEQLEIIYPSGEKVILKEELTPAQVKDSPTVKWNAKPDTFYTLVMVDPDAPSRRQPMFRAVNHWLVGNIRGNDLNSGDTIAEYIGAGPPKGTGLHRYVFLVYEQENKIEFDEPRISKTTIAHRPNFNTRNFAKKYNLGDPIAGNFFQSQWDVYVKEKTGCCLSCLCGAYRFLILPWSSCCRC